MEKVNYVFLHGFLGTPGDWSPLIECMQSFDPTAQYKALDYFAHPSLSSKNNFTQWTDNFLMWLESECGNDPVLLFGYSLGGRLALHAFEKHPERFERLFLLSTNPGLNAQQQQEKEKRLQDDQAWSRRFLIEPWSALMEAWNGQAVFKGSVAEPRREEVDYRRDLLAKALTNWSLAQQKDFLGTLKTHQKKITWVVGDLDKKYIQLTKEIFQSCPNMNYYICPQSGHRILNDNPEALYDGLSKVLNQIYNGLQPL